MSSSVVMAESSSSTAAPAAETGIVDVESSDKVDESTDDDSAEVDKPVSNKGGEPRSRSCMAVTKGAPKPEGAYRHKMHKRRLGHGVY